MLGAMGRFCNEVKRKDAPRWLTFLGASGNGKTYLAKRIWRWFKSGDQFAGAVAKGDDGRDEIVYPGQWCFWPQLAAELQANAGYDRLDELKRERFVVLDEIGADRDVNGHVKDCLARVLSARVGKWTVITSNKTMEEIANIDQRIASRMIRDGSEVVQVEVRDYFLR